MAVWYMGRVLAQTPARFSATTGGWVFLKASDLKAISANSPSCLLAWTPHPAPALCFNRPWGRYIFANTTIKLLKYT